MIDKIRAHFKDRFVIIWLSVILLCLCFVGAKFLFFNQASSSLEAVLTKRPQNSFDFSVFVASLLALSLASISVAKGYEVLKRNHAVTDTVLPDLGVDSIRSEIDNEEIAELKQALIRLEKDKDELHQAKEYIKHENMELKDQLNRLTFDHGEVSRAEQMLRKSNISLSRECERLTSENEVLLLKMDLFEATPLTEVSWVEPVALTKPKKTQTKKAAAKTRAKVKTKKRKKG
ncbi:MAG: hypothetical protein ABIH69_01510 [bacterium]